MEIIDKIFNSKLPRYEKLDKLLKPYISKYKPYENVNIYIDLYNYLKQFYNPQIIETLNSLNNSEKYTISSHIINIISHYRHYFASRKQMYTTFYFVYSTKECNYLKNILPEYKQDFYQKRLDTKHSVFGIFNNIIINTVFPICKTFIDYVPHAYFINTMELDPRGGIHYLISTFEKSNELNIIISNDDMYLQEIPISEDILNLQVRSEKTRIIYKNNIYDYLIEGTKNSKESFSLLPEHIKLVLTMVSHKDYSIKAINNMGYSRSMKFWDKFDIGILNEILNKGIISQYEKNNDLSFIKGKKDQQFIKEHYDEIKFNLSLINNSDILDNNFKNYIGIINSQIVNKVDVKGIKQVNNKYFAKEPVLIEYCFEGEEYL